MNPEQWTQVDHYLNGLFVADDDVLAAALQASDAAGLPQIQVAPNQGKLLSILARSIGARSMLEFGTLGGYSTIWLARALPEDGKLITMEYDPKHAEVAKKNIAHAGFATQVEVRLGKALDSLPQIEREGYTFDVVFIDADKANMPSYFEWALKLTRVGGLIIGDNVVRGGGVVNENSDDPNIRGVRKYLEMAASNPRVMTTAIQTVGSKGYDGLAMSLVVD